MKVVMIGSLDLDAVKELRGEPVVVLTGEIDDIRRCAEVLFQEVELVQRIDGGDRSPRAKATGK
jgi:hypothetical protein